MTAVAATLRGLLVVAATLCAALGAPQGVARVVTAADATPAAHGLGTRTLHVGAAAVIDLREGHHGPGAVYRIDPAGDPAPPGLSIIGHHLTGAPQAAGVSRLSIRVAWPETGREVLMPATLDVRPAEAGLFARARALRPPAGGGLEAAGPGVWRFRFAAGVEGPRHGALVIPTQPGVTYRMTAAIALDRAVEGPVTLRAAHVDGDPGRGDAFDDWDGFVGEVDHSGAAGVERVAMTFTPGRRETVIQLGAVWRGPRDWTRTGMGGRVVTLSQVRVEALPETAPVGGAVIADRFRRFGVTVTLDRPRLVGRYVNGEYWILNDAPETDPARIVALAPVDGGAQLNWGATAERYGERAQGFDRRAGRKGALLQVPYDPQRNVDPFHRGAPIVWAADAAGVEGSVDKAVLQPYRRYFTGGRQSLLEQTPITVVTRRPPPDAFMPPTAIVAKRHRRIADLGADWLARLLPDLSWPADAPPIEPEALRYFMARPHQIGVQNQPRDRSVMARYNGREYGREQSRRWDAVLIALLADPADGGLPAQERVALALQAIQFGIALHGRAEAGGVWIANGGGSQNRKPFALLAALAFGDPAMLARVDNRRDGWKPFAEDAMIRRVAPEIIAPGYRPPDFNPATLKRPRAPYEPFMLGMPEWRNERKTGANYLGDGYRGIAMTSSLGGWLFMTRLKGAIAASGDPVGIHYADRHFQWAVNGVRRGEAGIDPAVAAMWRAHRAGGAPVAMHRWGLVETGAIGGDDPRDAAAGAVDVPVLRSWREGAPGVLDLSAEEFNARAGLADGAPTRFAPRGAADAAGAPTPWPEWARVSPEGLLTATPPDTALRFLDVAGMNARGEAVARIALQAAPAGVLRGYAVEGPSPTRAASQRRVSPLAVAAGDHLVVDIVTGPAAIRSATVAGRPARLLASTPADGRIPRLWRLIATAPAGGWTMPALELRLSSPTRVFAVGWTAASGTLAGDPPTRAGVLRGGGGARAPDAEALTLWFAASLNGDAAPPVWPEGVEPLGQAAWRGGAAALTAAPRGAAGPRAARGAAMLSVASAFGSR